MEQAYLRFKTRAPWRCEIQHDMLKWINKRLQWGEKKTNSLMFCVWYLSPRGCGSPLSTKTVCDNWGFPCCCTRLWGYFFFFFYPVLWWVSDMNNFAYGFSSFFFTFSIRHQSWTDGEGLEERRVWGGEMVFQWLQDNLTKSSHIAPPSAMRRHCRPWLP